MMTHDSHPLQEFALASDQALDSMPFILLVHDDAAVIEHLGEILQAYGRVLFAMDAETALYQAQEHRIALVIVGDHISSMPIIELYNCLQAIDNSAAANLLIVTDNHDPAYASSILESGIADCILLPLSPPLLKARVDVYLKLYQQSELLRSHASVDSLTGVANLEALNRALAREWQRSYRNGSLIAVLMIEINQFKQYIEYYDRNSVEQCLKAIASVLARAVNRPADLLARYSEHKFAILLPETSLKGARLLAERMCTAVRALRIRHANSTAASIVSVSVGVAAMDPSSLGRTRQDVLIKAAEEALHFTKLSSSVHQDDVIGP